MTDFATAGVMEMMGIMRGLRVAAGTDERWRESVNAG